MPFTYKEFLQNTKSLNEDQVKLIRDMSDMMAHVVSNAYLCENGYKKKLGRGEIMEQDVPFFQKPYKDIRDIYNGVAGEIYKLGRIWGEDSKNAKRRIAAVQELDEVTALIDKYVTKKIAEYDKLLSPTDADKEKNEKANEQPASEYDKWCSAYPKSSAELDKDAPERTDAKLFEKKTVTSADIKGKLQDSLVHIGISEAEKQKLGKIYEDFGKLLKPASELNKDGMTKEQWENGLKDAVDSFRSMLSSDGFCKKYYNAIKTEQEFEIQEQDFYPNYKMYYPLDTFNKLVGTLNDNFGAGINVDQMIKDSEKIINNENIQPEARNSVSEREEPAFTAAVEADRKLVQDSYAPFKQENKIDGNSIKGMRKGITNIVAASILVNSGKMKPDDKNFEAEKNALANEIGKNPAYNDKLLGQGPDALEKTVEKVFSKNGNALRFDYFDINAPKADNNKINTTVIEKDKIINNDKTIVQKL